MKETGITMSGNLPKLILDGTKTMTRRTWGLEGINAEPDVWTWIGNDGAIHYFHQEGSRNRVPVKCPYGGVGDWLWVKEAWASPREYDSLSPIGLWNHPTIWYLADGDKPDWAGKTRSPMFVCKWMSRIWRQITGLRAERLQDISLEDALAEGMILKDMTYGHELISNMRTWSHISDMGWGDHKDAFRFLWDSHNPKYSWDFNPWNWVISW